MAQTDVVIARHKPYYCELKQGRTYLWCACGRSKNQPFCDGSHQGTGIKPVRHVARADEEVLFCGCKHSRTPPFCDGAHNNLTDKYAEDDPASPENARIPVVAAGAEGKAVLDGGCYVCSVESGTFRQNGTLRYRDLIAKSDGAIFQSQFYFAASGGTSPVVSFGDRHVVLFVGDGSGTVTISGRDFAVAPRAGVYVRPGEAFRLTNAQDRVLTVYAAVCPQADAVPFLDAMPENFDQGHPERTIGIDPDARNRMGDRFFQILIDKRHGSDVVTQFIGDIPLSKAAPHRHLYEESLVIVTGAGFMWTENGKAPVKAGDIIFLPRKQLHSLQCTDPAGMLVAGVIYPGDNPSINY